MTIRSAARSSKGIAPHPSRLTIGNIGQLVCVPAGPVPGSRMNHIERIANAMVVIEDGRIAAFGPDDGTGRAAPGFIDAEGGCVVPGLIDCHTHLVHAGSRENEFVKRIEGKTYAQIAAEGGGIKVSVAALRAATMDQLIESALPRLRRMLAGGVTTVEIKSGYGLNHPDEIKTLRAVKRLKALQPVELVATFLGAHVPPYEYLGRADAFIDHITEPAFLETIVAEGLAEFCDVFCDRGAFDVPQSERFLTACRSAGMNVKVHADQIEQIGAGEMAGRLGAVSADHLEQVTDAGIAAMKQAGTIPVLLPGCTLYLDSPRAPARKLMEAGLPVALATDFNPGSSPIESLHLIASLGCTLLRMTPMEVLAACTANAAAAIRRADRIGCIEVGKQADLLILDVGNIEQWAYYVGRNCVRAVIKQGELVAGCGSPA